MSETEMKEQIDTHGQLRIKLKRTIKQKESDLLVKQFEEIVEWWNNINKMDENLNPQADHYKQVKI